ncbi:MAG: prepilin-type N-terminal cleavage/methylation domain-containing protein [Aphanocapsa sp. GSE-SYN-MK-11-07L]|jgi:type IV pilus assembly protein PilW|nr:prepilin-type N-terminal cleavage/methylation domain-containing protein [Aphanocapsa sp. GSE-SYN-MK-11-07L]
MQRKLFTRNFGNSSRWISLWLKACRVSPNANRGLTLVELLVATIIASMVLGVAFGGATFNRRLYLEDQVRNSVDQNLRSAMDLLGADIRQAGEYVNRQDPAVPVIQLSDDAANPGSSILTIRRDLFDRALPVCADLGTAPSTPAMGVTEITVFDSASTVARCNNDSSGSIASLLTLWASYITANGGQARAYLYNGNGGQFVNVTAVNGPGGERTITADSFNGLEVYLADSQSRLALYEERRYSLIPDPANANSKILQMVLNDDIAPGRPLNLVNGLTSFKVSIFLAGNPLVTRNSFCQYTSNPATPCTTTSSTGSVNDAWTTIRSVQVSLVGIDTDADAGGSAQQVTIRRDATARSLTQQFLPRNVLNF